MVEYYKVLEWNINLESNTNSSIPGFVSKSIIEQEADIVILTEFVHCNNAGDFLKNTFINKGYDYITSENSKNKKVNDIVIAWNKKKLEQDNSQQVFYSNCNKTENTPNFLTVPLKDVKNKNNFRIAGVRITMTPVNRKNYPSDLEFYSAQGSHKYKQMHMIYSTLAMLIAKKTKVLIAGDFNNFQRFTIVNNWNINRITCERGDYCLYTPYGGSWKNDNYPLDHFITKECQMMNYEYNREFTKNNNIYQNGESLEGIKSPNPDHAMLIGTLVIN